MKSGGLVSVLVLIGLAASPALADISYDLDIDHCTGTCGTAPFGVVTLTQNVSSVTVNVSLKAGEYFIKTGAGGEMAFGFSLVGDPTISVTNISPGWATLFSASAGSIHMDGFGDLDYAIWCSACANGGPGKQVGPLQFDVSGATLSMFEDLSRGGDDAVYFVADIMGTNGLTGVVGAVGQTQVPEPASILGLGTVLLLIGSRLRRKKA